MKRFEAVNFAFLQAWQFILDPLDEPIPSEEIIFVAVLLFAFCDDFLLYKNTIAHQKLKIQNERKILQMFESMIACWMPITAIALTQFSLKVAFALFAVFFLLKICAGYLHYTKNGALNWRYYSYSYFLIVPCAIPLIYLCGFDPLTSVWVIALITATQSALWWIEGWVRK